MTLFDKNKNDSIIKRSQRILQRENELNTVKKDADNNVQDKWKIYIESLVLNQLKIIPIDKLSYIYKSLPITVLKDNGIATVRDAYYSGDYSLNRLPGVGPSSVFKIRQATEKIVELTKEEINPRLNPDDLTKEATDVIQSVASSIHIDESYNKYSKGKGDFNVYYFVKA